MSSKILKAVTWLPKTICCGVGFHYKGVDGLSCTHDRTHCTHCGTPDVFVLVSVDNTAASYEIVNQQREEKCSNAAKLVSGMIIRPFVFMLAAFGLVILLLGSV